LVHIAHLTSREGVELVRAARAAGTTTLTAETCPHYLLFTSEVLERVGAFGKINPPIREQRDQDALWQGLQDGTIDVIATDHSPFTVAEKEVAPELVLSAPPGHPGVEILVPFVMTQALGGRLTLNQAIDLISTRPAKMFNLYPRKGALAPGSDADITIYDPDGEHIVRRENWLTKVADANRLYDGWTSRGRVHTTVLNGKVIYCQGKFLGQPGDGKLVRPL
jgi:allantoinase